MKKVFFILIIILINLAVVIAAGEMYARIKHGDRLDMQAEESAYRRADFRLHHSLIPGSRGRSMTGEWDVEYRINGLGLRDKEFSIKKQEGTYRILVLGDSFTEGYGVQASERFTSVLQEALKGEDGDYEVINAGVASYSPLLEYLYLKEKGLALDPDMVILFYDFGDLRDDLEYENITVFDDAGLPLECAPLKRVRAFSDNPVERFLVRHSRFYLYVENRVNKQLYKLRKPDAGRSPSGDDAANFDRFVAFKENNTDLIDRLWTRSRGYLDLIDGLLKDSGVTFVLAIYPIAVEIDGMEWSEGREEYGFVVGRVYPEPEIAGMVEKYAEEKGIKFINLYPYMAASGQKPLYFSFDGHFTPKGHEVMGKGLYEELRDLLPGE